jgi:hypothetical protein
MSWASLLVTEMCLGVGRLRDASASRLRLRDVVGGVVVCRDAFEGGGRVFGISWAPETCFGVGAGSGICQSHVWDRGMLWEFGSRGRFVLC